MIPDFETDLSEEEALIIIEPYYEALYENFLEAGLGQLKKVQLVCSWEARAGERNFAGCVTDGSAIIVAPDLAELPISTMEGILAHELGHASDFLYPGSFQAASRTKLRVYDREEYEDKAWRSILRSWKERDDDMVEVTADLIAERVLGVRIGYMGNCKLQTIGKGPRRPRGLR